MPMLGMVMFLKAVCLCVRAGGRSHSQADSAGDFRLLCQVSGHPDVSRYVIPGMRFNLDCVAWAYQEPLNDVHVRICT